MGTWESIDDETPIDPSFLINKGILCREELDAAEAKNIAPVIARYLASKPTKSEAPFTYAWCLQLHRDMFCDVWQWAGQIRSVDVNIGIPFATIGTQLSTLLDDLPHWSDCGQPMIEQSARLHHRAVQIHPFSNGNGRWARMLGNIWLRLNEGTFVEWPEDAIGSTSAIRSEYIVAIKSWDHGDAAPLIDMHRKYLRPFDAD